MTFLLAAPAVPTTPGVEVVSSDGSLTAVVHDGFPGVLLRVLGAGVEATVWRGDGREWVRVRSGSPLPLSLGEGWAYDAEAAPDGTYVYALDMSDPGSAVAVRLPGWVDDEWSAWLVPADDPGLARLVTVEWPPSPYGLSGSSVLTPIRDQLSTGTRGRRGGLAWSVTLLAWDEQERDAVMGLLDAGPLLYHPHPACQAPLRAGWLLPGDVSVDSEGADEWTHAITVAVAQTSRPWPGDAPLRVPGWGWVESTSGLADAASYASAYPTTWAQLKAGVGGWSQ